jgi:hypothetical protein
MQMWRTSRPSASPNPDFKLQHSGRAAKPLTFDTSNYGNGTNKAYVDPEKPTFVPHWITLR